MYTFVLLICYARVPGKDEYESGMACAILENRDGGIVCSQD